MGDPLFPKRLSYRMRLFLLSLCLVGLAQAGPTAPSFITDPQIRALYELTDIRANKVTWRKNDQKFDFEVCIDKADGFVQASTIGVLRIGGVQHQLGNVNKMEKDAS